MTKPTRRELWAFCAGQDTLGMLIGFVAHLPGLFLLNGLLLAYAVFMYLDAKSNTEGN